MLYYAGVGSRDIPNHVAVKMTAIASILEDKGYILRSGGAIGSDTAFELGVKSMYNKEIYYMRDYLKDGEYHSYNDYDNTFACDVVKKYHPNKNLDKKIRVYDKTQFKYVYDYTPAFLLIKRNTHQAFGAGKCLKDYKKMSKFIVCYTKDGGALGGTGQIIRIGLDLNIPIYNLQHKKYIEMTAEEIVDVILRGL